MSKLRIVIGGLVGIAVVVAVIIGASSGGDSSGGSGSKTSATLKVWLADDDLPKPAVAKLNAAFEKQHPGVTVSPSFFSFSDLQTKGKLSLSGANPPDASQVGIPLPVIGQLIKAGKLRNLDAMATKYGWTKRFAASGLAPFRFSAAGKSGSGSLYAIYQTISPVGVYYDRDQLKALGLEVPTSFEQFEQALATAKARGKLPVMFANLDKYEAIHEFGTIQAQYVAKPALRAFTRDQPGGTFKDPGTTTAADTLVDWAKKGYFTKDYQALGFDDSLKRFAKGQGVFTITGTWAAPQLSKSMGKNVGFFLMPPASGGQLASVSGSNQAWVIPAKAKHATLAGEYLDFLASPQAERLYAAAGQIPGTVTEVPQSTNPLFADVQKAGRALNQQDGAVDFLDITTPTMYDTITAGLQELLAGRRSVASFISSVQADFDKANQ